MTALEEFDRFWQQRQQEVDRLPRGDYSAGFSDGLDSIQAYCRHALLALDDSQKRLDAVTALCDRALTAYWANPIGAAVVTLAEVERAAGIERGPKR